MATVAEKGTVGSIASSGLYRVSCGVRSMKKAVDAAGAHRRQLLGLHFDRIAQFTQAVDQ